MTQTHILVGSELVTPDNPMPMGLLSDAREGALQHVTGVTLGDAGEVTTVDLPDWARGVRVTPSETIWWAINEDPVIEPVGEETVYEIASGADDGRYDDDLTYAATGGTLTVQGTFWAWLRYDNVVAEQGSEIPEVILQFVAGGTINAETGVIVQCVDADDPAAPANLGAAQAMPLTTALAEHELADGYNAGEVVSIPGIEAPINEDLAREGWTSGNAIICIVKQAVFGALNIAAYEHETYDPAHLIITGAAPEGQWLTGNVATSNGDVRLLESGIDRELRLVSEDAAASVLVEVY